MPQFTYPCFLLKQRLDESGVPTFCLFYAPVGAILQWAAIERIQTQRGAVQRAMNPGRVRGVKRFFTEDRRNTIPTSVVLTLKVKPENLRKVTVPDPDPFEMHVLSFEVPENVAEKDKPGLVVDGQHRLLGMREFSPNLQIPVVALLNPDGLETAFQFLVINNKAAKVPTDHIKSLALEYTEEGLDQRLRTARLTLNENYIYVGQVNGEEGSPFKDLIDWPANRTGQRIVIPAAIEQSLQYIQTQNLKDLREPDPLLEFFYAVWGAVKAAWPELWNAESKFLEKVGVICMTQYVTDSLAKLYEWGELDLNEPDEVRRRTNTLLQKQSPEFWRKPWKSTSYDTRVGRQLIVDDLVQVTRNLRAGEVWHADLKVVDAS